MHEMNDQTWTLAEELALALNAETLEFQGDGKPAPLDLLAHVALFWDATGDFSLLARGV